VNESERIVADGYDAVYEAIPRAPSLWRIWIDQAIGSDFPDEFSHISFATLADMRRYTEQLQLIDDAVLVDMACGMGGPALWIAAQLPIRLVGIDASPVAVAMATQRSTQLGLGARSTFRTGTFSNTGLATEAADGVLSLDALQYAPDKSQAFEEIARILRPGGRLVFSAFEVDPERVAGMPVLCDDPAADYRPLLDSAGLTIESYEETAGALDRVEASYRAILDDATALRREMGADAYGALSLEVASTLESQPYRRRIAAVATRR